MIKPKHELAVGLFLFLIAALIGWHLMSELGLAQDEPDVISVTPPLWLESKAMKWDGAQYEYLVFGWWFTDNEYPGHHVGDWRTFPVTRDVFWNVLTRDPQDRVTQRLCKLGFVDGKRVASLSTCVNGTQYFLPLTME